MESLGLPAIDMSILFNIHQIKKESEARAISKLIEFKLNLPQIDILADLLIWGQATSTELAERLKVSKANLTGMISRLEKRGLVAREDSLEDGRSKIIKLTITGKGLVEKVIPEHIKNISNFMSVIPEDEKKLLESNLALILEAVKKH